jgi:excisionase family DNA binding protein
MLTVGEAAERLGVSAHEVRRLIRTGVLPASRVGRTLVLDDEAVEMRARLPIGAGRALAPQTAWAALWELSGLRVDWLDAASRSRLRARVSRLDPAQLVAATRRRADRKALRVLPGYRDRVLAADGVVLSGMSASDAVGAGVVATAAADEIYCTATELAALQQAFGLSERGEANLIVRIPAFDELPFHQEQLMPVAVVAVDLAESADVRTRRAGHDLLAGRLSALRG